MIKYQQNNELGYGENIITTESNREENMLMDFSVFKGKAMDQIKIHEDEKEVATILFSGKIKIKWEDHEEVVSRTNVFDEGPYVLHVCHGVDICIELLEESEIGIQKATNARDFASKFYTPEDCVDQIFGKEGLNGTARRMVRDVFKYQNAPYSNMVLGEVITYPGRWSSYPPHSHEQPEVYYYKFTKPQGFGVGFVGDETFKIQNNSTLLIKGDLSHPQTAAPGYGMYYCWMIRNFENNPWDQRVMEKEHEWLLDPNAEIWEPKEK